MTPTLQQLDDWLAAREDEHLEFKEAKGGFHFEKLVKYCAALANEGGGSIILGVTDRRPRRVVGSNAFENLERTKAGLIERLRLRIEASEICHPNGRVLVFTAPARAIGGPIAVEGAYWMRAGEDLAPMTTDMLRRIFDESAPDFSAEVCAGAQMSDLEPEAIEEFRRRWHARSRLDSLLKCSVARLLRDADLITGKGVTYAALILLGTRAALTHFRACAEVVFEYRSSEVAGPASQRVEFQQGFLLGYDRIWDLINLRNDKQHYQDGFVMLDVPTFSEGCVREAILNAVAHRDYRHAGSVFVRQFSRRVEIVSPGGFPSGITAENILYCQHPRNRRLADSFARCGLVDRAGQGADRMFDECVRQSKPLPDFTHTDSYQVSLTLHGEVEDAGFLQFLQRIRREEIDALGTQDLLVLDCVHHERRVPPELRPWLRKLVALGVVELIGRGSGTRYLLSQRLYTMTGPSGAYARHRRLDRTANKALLLQHVRSKAEIGARFEELQEVLPTEGRIQVQRLMRELRREGLVESRGTTKATRWFAAKPGSNSVAKD